jgi:predicted RNA-binding protein (virulence factor B family)
MSHGLEAGMVVSLRIAKEVTPFGFFLTDEDQEVLLHYTQIVGQIEIDQVIDVYLYHDAQDRLSATMKHAYLKLGEVGLLEVVDIHPRFGSFLEMGLGRQLLLPFREQPEMKELRPIVGDKVYVVLSHDRQGRLIAKLAGEEELVPKAFHAPTAWKNQMVTARVYKPLQLGSFVVIEGGVLGGFGAIGMIHSSERTELVRLGQQVQVRVIFVREDGRANLSMRPLKEVGRDEDADTLLEYLKAQSNQAMPFSDESSVESIYDQFNISKSAFKRALGKLMRNGLVVQKEGWTHLKQAEE